MQWYQGSMRIAALQCNYEDGKNLAVIPRWKAMGFNVEQLFHPMADGYSALYDRERHGEILARYLAAAHRAGLRVILYLNVHIIGRSEAHRRDEWAQQAKDGSWPLSYDTYHPCCYTGPWRGHFFGVIDALADVDIDGVFLDGPSMTAGGCHCVACRAAFQRQYGAPLDGADEKTRWKFYAGQRSEYLTLSYRRFKALKPEAVFYINLPVTNPAASYADIRDALTYNDIVGSEGGFLFYGPAQKAFLWKPGVRARMLEAVAPDRPRVIFMAADHKPWSWYPNTPVETRLCIASSTANGASIWWGLHGSTRLLSTPGARAAGDAIAFLARNEEHFAGARSAARVAVLHSYDTERERGLAVEASDLYGTRAGGKQAAGDFGRSFEGFADAFCRWSVPWDAVTDLDLSAGRLAAYDLLVLPTCSCLSERTVADIRAYVERGGSLVATFDTSRFDDRGAARLEPGLAEVLGISARGSITDYRDHNYFELAAPASGPRGPARLAAKLRSGIEIPLVPAPRFAVDVEPRPGAVVLASYHAPMAGRYVDLTPLGNPAIVANRFGRGTAVYLAGTFGEMLAEFALPEHRRLAVNLVDALSRRDVRLEAGASGGDPINVEMTVRVPAAQPSRLVVHLVNHAGVAPRPFEAVSVQAGLRLRAAARLGVRSARALAAGKRLRVARDAKGTCITLPPLAEYEVVVLETGG
jgi:hypothetical protein